MEYTPLTIDDILLGDIIYYQDLEQMFNEYGDNGDTLKLHTYVQHWNAQTNKTELQYRFADNEVDFYLACEQLEPFHSDYLIVTLKVRRKRR